MSPCPLAASRTACIFSLFWEANCSIFFGSPVTLSVMITDMAGHPFSCAFVGRFQHRARRRVNQTVRAHGAHLGQRARMTPELRQSGRAERLCVRGFARFL